jgi:hypothetical protein
MYTTTHLNRLAQLIEREGRNTVERTLNVHRTTIKRWLNGTVKMPEGARALVEGLLGNLPGTEGKWAGWYFWKGELWSPSNQAFTAGQISAQFFERQLIKTQEREIVKLKAKLAYLETQGLQSANERLSA